jgi:hypothetical protein
MLRLSPGGTPVTGKIDLYTAIVKKGTRYDISSLDLRIGGETIGGKASIDVSGKRPIADINIGAQNIILPKLAAYLVDWQRKDISSQLAEATSGKSIWPSQAFSFRAFESADGKLKMKADTMLLTDGLTLSKAEFQASLKDGALTVSKLDGKLYDGAFSGNGSLKSTNGRIALNGHVKLDNIDIAKLTAASDAKPLFKSEGDLELAFAGEGFSPRGLVTIATGKGTFNLTKGVLDGLSPSAIKNAADNYPEEKAAKKKKRWSEQLTGKLRKGKLNIPAISAPVMLQNGLLQVQDLKVAGKNYKTEIDTTLDFSTFHLDSAWEVITSRKSKYGEDLPPVRIVFAGPIANFTALQPRIDHGELERFLSFKGTERKMERLEKLNRQLPDGNNRRSRSSSSQQNNNTPPTAALPPTQRNSQPQPSQSSLTEMPEPDTSPPSGADGSDKAKSPPAAASTFPGWSTRTEEQAPASPSAARVQENESSEDFKDRIRRALRSSENANGGPAVREPPEDEANVPQN